MQECTAALILTQTLVATCLHHHHAPAVCMCVCVLSIAVLLPQATCSIRHMHIMDGRHTWHGPLPTCASTRPPTAQLLCNGGTQHERHWGQASGEFVGHVQACTSVITTDHKGPCHGLTCTLSVCAACLAAVLTPPLPVCVFCCRYDWDSTLPGAAAVLASMPTVSVSTAARDWLETFVLAKWEVRGHLKSGSLLLRRDL